MTPDITVAAAQQLIGLGWPVMPVKPRSKEPLTRHGVKDATTDERTVLHWFERWPDANLAIATGAPGPSVLDIDNPQAANGLLVRLKQARPPEVATPRGAHLYYAGTAHGTVSLGYGELRGRGSYVLVPPSIHPSGKEYVWLQAPNGRLHPVPVELADTSTRTAGTGTFDAPELIGHGQRHDALKDAAVRFLRGGFTDVPTLEQMLQAFFHARCDPTPASKRGEFRKIAEWASQSQIAQRERETATLEPEQKAEKEAKPLNRPPGHNATLKDHRDYLRKAGGWPDAVDIQHVTRNGSRGIDHVEILLSSGQRIRLRQEQVNTRGHWARTVITATSGLASPPPITDQQLLHVLRSLCLLADTPAEEHEAEALQDAITDMLATAEALTGHDLETYEGRYELVARLRARGPYDPRRTEVAPVVILDSTGRRYLRAGEVRDYLALHLGISYTAVPGHLRELGADRIDLHGREPARPDRAGRQTNRTKVYRLPQEGL